MWKFGGWILIFVVLVGCDSTVKPMPVGERPSTTEVEPPAAIIPPTNRGVISVLSWNVESGGSDPAVIAKQLKVLGEYDIYCLSEVDPKSLDQNATALGDNFMAINGKTGRDDRLQIIFNKDRFELLEQKELMEYREFILNNGTHRSPLYARLKDKATGLQFIVMTNHLARGMQNCEQNKQLDCVSGLVIRTLVSSTLAISTWILILEQSVETKHFLRSSKTTSSLG